MSPNEIAVLRIVEETGVANKRIISHRMDISTNYAAYICNSLTKNGYLSRTTSKGYELTPKGKKFLLSLLYQDKGRIEAGAKRLQDLNYEVSQKIVKLAREEALK